MSVARVAVVQAAPVVFDRERTIEKVRDLTADAARGGAGLVLFPEAFVSAYPMGLDFGARVGSRTPEGREDFRRYYDSAVDVPGPACAALGDAARAGGRPSGDRRDRTRWRNALLHGAVLRSRTAALLGKHRKLMPTAVERLIWGFGDGSTMPVIETPLAASAR